MKVTAGVPFTEIITSPLALSVEHMASIPSHSCLEEVEIPHTHVLPASVSSSCIVRLHAPNGLRRLFL